MATSIDDNAFLGLPLATLQSLQTTYLQVLTDIATTGQSYTFPGRSLTRANLPEVKELLGDVRLAIDYQTKSRRQIANAVVRTDQKF